jgi:uncharacterized cupin superfamily protein
MNGIRTRSPSRGRGLFENSQSKTFEHATIDLRHDHFLARKRALKGLNEGFRKGGKTMARHKHLIHLSEVPVEKINAPERSPFGGFRQRAGTQIGAQKLGYSFFTVPAGKAAFPYHTHTGNEEMIYITDGHAILRFGGEEIPVSAGTVIACPPGAGYPHQLINTSNKELCYLVVSTMEYPDISEYPDSKKIGAYATPAVGQQVGFRALYLKDQNVNYYEGEDGKDIERVQETAKSQSSEVSGQKSEGRK